MTEFKWGRPKSELDKADEEFAKIHIENAAILQEPDAPELAQVQVNNSNEKFLIHRSAILTYKACPYKYFLEYALGGHGVVSFAMPQHLLIGIAIHRGLQHLLEHCRVEHPDGDFSEKCIDDAVDFAHKVFVEVIEKREIELKKKWNGSSYDVEDLNYTIKEIYNLIEALIRAYAVYRLRNFLEEYEVLEVEKEEVFDSFSDIVTWLGKADGLLRRKKDNELVILSFKTASEFGNSNMFNIRIDMQGCSEIIAVEDRLNKHYKIFYEAFVKANAYVQEVGDELHNYFHWKIRQTIGFVPIQVFANQYEYLVKGKHRADSSEPLKYKYQTHLLHAVKSDSAAVAQLGSGLRFGASGSIEYEWVIPQGKLPKGKKKFDVADDVGVKVWVDMLARGEVQPEKGDALEGVIIAGEERLAKRSLEQLKEWRISTQFEAEEIAERVRTLNDLKLRAAFPENESSTRDMLLEIYETKLKQFFRRDGMDSQLCYAYYGDKCPFTEHCHKGVMIEDGLESGMWIVREPHHELEVERFKEKGFLKED